MSSAVPTKTSVLVIGGGPAGSYAAAVLVREGMDVTLLEAANFPRYHVGEGMLPSMRHYLKYIDCEEIFDKHGFMPKPGACFKLRSDLRETYTDFNALGPNFSTWNVIRSEADELLLNHAENQGVKVFQGTRVESLDFVGDPSDSRPVKANWSNKSGANGTIEFEWLVDASGRAGIMSTKYLKNRRIREHLRNVAVWGYWREVALYEEGTIRSHVPWFEAMTDGLGWCWVIPLHDGTTSIGIVMHQSVSNEKKKTTPSLKEHYLEQLQLVPGVLKRIGEKGYLVENSMHASTDYSYAASRYSGDHYRMVGDAANFVDPFFSSGVHCALNSALAAATTIRASFKGEAEETQAQLWHDAKVGISHTRFLFVVLGAYKQMHQQDGAVLTDVDSDSFDNAFAMFRPVIAGLPDTSGKLTEPQINKVMEFCANIFDPTVGIEHLLAVRKRYKEEYSDLYGPILTHEEVETLTGDDVEGKKVITKMNALKVLREERDFSTFEAEGLDGLVADTTRGKLGLRKKSHAENGEK